MSIEKTLILIKPDAIFRKLTGLVLYRLDNAGFEMIAAKTVSVTEELARKHYEALKDKPFFEELVKFIMGKFHNIPRNRILALIYKGENAIQGVREIVGATNPEDAMPHTIRGSLGKISTKGLFENVVHASGNREDAEREIKLWFNPEEIIE